MLAMPTLTSLLPKAYAQSATNSNLRLLMMNQWYGRDYQKWYSHDGKAATTKVTTNGGYAYRSLSDLAGDISPILPSALWDTTIRRKMTIVRGLDIVDMHDGHNTTVATSGSLESGGAGTKPFGYSFDGLLEGSAKFYPTAARASAIRLSPLGSWWNIERSDTNFSWTTKNGSREILYAYSWPHTIYEKYFSTTVVNAATQRATRLQVATNSAYQDFSKVMASQKISSEDKKRLDHYMQLLSQAEQKLKIQATQTGGVCAAPGSAASLPKDFELYKSSDFIYETGRDLMTVALACGMTKLAVMNHMLLGPDFDRDTLGNDQYHDCAHNPAGEKYKFPALNMNRYVYDHAAKFIRQLDSVQDIDGNTLLDNTLVYIGNDDSTGNHELYDMPVILAGAKNILRTDMMIDYRNTANKKGENGVLLGRPINNLFISIFKAFGLETADYKMTADQKGFGYSTNRTASQIKESKGEIYKSHYGQFMTDAAKDEELPYLLLKS